MSSEFEILLYYLYEEIQDPESFASSQRRLCAENDIMGRIIISKEGINGTVSGNKEATDKYRKQTLDDLGTDRIQFKVDSSEGHAFKKLSVKVRSEIVSLQLDSEGDINPNKKTGERLAPEQFLSEMESGEVIVFDGRNKYESDLGKFKGAVCPPVDNFREFPEWIRENFSHAKDKRVLTYCTGGIRCEKLSGFLLEEGFKSVAQLDGGIINYSKDSKTKGKNFDGECYVFDQRIGVEVNSDNPKIISRCIHCDQPSQRYRNCGWKPCNDQIFICDSCEEKFGKFCGEQCRSSYRKLSPQKPVSNTIN